LLEKREESKDYDEFTVEVKTLSERSSASFSNSHASFRSHEEEKL